MLAPVDGTLKDQLALEHQRGRTPRGLHPHRPADLGHSGLHREQLALEPGHPAKRTLIAYH